MAARAPSREWPLSSRREQPLSIDFATVTFAAVSRRSPFEDGPAGQPATSRPLIFAQPDDAAVWAHHGRVVEQLQVRFADAAKMLDEAAGELLAFTAFPKANWKQLWSNKRSG